ncbi:MAG: histidinol-phosphatase HisJ family protein [Verrucomicrobia bacterium]|nr:histidinol-phosphatase HisJ family protein [Verrucomicrobiota bacterium]
MGLPPDYHIHTPLCRHAEGAPVEYAAWAKRRGLEEIGFSDHAPMPRDDFDDWRMKASELSRYAALVEEARRAHPEMTIRLGLEVDYLPGMEDWIRELSGRYEWDYLIGSVHYVGDWDIDNPVKASRWESEDTLHVWVQYAERLTEAAASGLFDILGHLDLCKKFGYRPEGKIAELFRPLLQLAAEKGLAVELNTAGLRKECREMYPSAEILAMAADYGVGLTFGSDAHAPRETAWEFESAVSAAKAAGYDSSLQFIRRRRVRRPL